MPAGGFSHEYFRLAEKIPLIIFEPGIVQDSAKVVYAFFQKLKTAK